jgi:hypothetical protein
MTMIPSYQQQFPKAEHTLYGTTVPASILYIIACLNDEYFFAAGWISESAFSEQALRYTPISRLLIGASRSMLAYFLPSNKFSFLYLSLYRTFESETCQFTGTFEKDFGKNSSGFLRWYIYTFKNIFC